MLVCSPKRESGTCVPGDVVGVSKPSDQFLGFGIWLMGQGWAAFLQPAPAGCRTWTVQGVPKSGTGLGEWPFPHNSCTLHLTSPWQSSLAILPFLPLSQLRDPLPYYF